MTRQAKVHSFPSKSKKDGLDEVVFEVLECAEKKACMPIRNIRIWKIRRSEAAMDDFNDVWSKLLPGPPVEMVHGHPESQLFGALNRHPDRRVNVK